MHQSNPPNLDERETKELARRQRQLLQDKSLHQEQLRHPYHQVTHEEYVSRRHQHVRHNALSFSGKRMIPALGRPSYYLEDEDTKYSGFVSDPSLSEDGGESSSQTSNSFQTNNRSHINVLPISPNSAEVSSLGNTSLSSKESEIGETTKSPRILPNKIRIHYKPNLDIESPFNKTSDIQNNDETDDDRNTNSNENSILRDKSDHKKSSSFLSPFKYVSKKKEKDQHLSKQEKDGLSADSKKTIEKSATSSKTAVNSPMELELFSTPDSELTSPNSKQPTILIPADESPDLIKNLHNSNVKRELDTEMKEEIDSNKTKIKTYIPEKKSSNLEVSSSLGKESKYTNTEVALKSDPEKMNFNAPIGDGNTRNLESTEVEHDKEDADDENSHGPLGNNSKQRSIFTLPYRLSPSKHRRISSGDKAAASIMGNENWFGMEFNDMPRQSSTESLNENGKNAEHYQPIKHDSQKNNQKRYEQSTISNSIDDEDFNMPRGYPSKSNRPQRLPRGDHNNYHQDTSVSSPEFFLSAPNKVNTDKNIEQRPKGSPRFPRKPRYVQRSNSRDSTGFISVSSNESQGSKSSAFSWISSSLISSSFSYWSGKAGFGLSKSPTQPVVQDSNHHNSFLDSYNENSNENSNSLSNSQIQSPTSKEVAPNLCQRFSSSRSDDIRPSPQEDESSYIFGKRENLFKKELESPRVRAFDNFVKSLSDVKSIPRRNIAVPEEDADKYPTYICPKCKTRQREFFTVASAPGEYENPLGFLFLYFVIYVFASLFIFGLEEGWPALDCIYFSVMTITSAGLGDYVPTTDGAKIICSIFIYFGVACIGLLLGSLLAGSLDDASRITAKENLVKNCPNCNRSNFFAKQQPYFNNKEPPINQASMQQRQNERQSEITISPNLNATPRVSNNASAMRQKPFPQNEEVGDKEDIYSGIQQQIQPENNVQMNKHINEHHPLLDKNNASFSTDFGSVTSQTVEPHFFRSPVSSAGSYDPVAVINRQSHTRHLSLRQLPFSGDFGRKSMFENPMKRNNQFSYRTPEPAVFSKNEHKQFYSEQTDRLDWEDDNFDDEFHDEFDSDSLSSDYEDNYYQKPKKNNDLKTAKYVFQTLHQALSNSTLIIAIGSIGFYIIEGMSPVNAFYFTTVLLTTVGYGDIVPRTNEGKLFATVYVLVAGTILLHNMSLISMIPLEMRKRRIEKIVLSQFGESVDDATLLELASGPLVQRLNMSANRKDGLHRCTREMFALAMLVRLGRVTERDVRSTFAAFNRLDLDKDGKLDSKEIIMSTVQRQRLLARMQMKQTSATNQNEHDNIEEFSDCYSWKDQNSLDGNEVHSKFNDSMAYSDNQSSYYSPSRRSFSQLQVMSQMDGRLSPIGQALVDEYPVVNDVSNLETGQYRNDMYGSYNGRFY